MNSYGVRPDPSLMSHHVWSGGWCIPAPYPLLLYILSRLLWYWGLINTLRPRHNGRHFADDIFKCIFLNENASIAIKISLKFVPKGPINNIPALVQIMAWRRPGDKPLSEPMMVSLLTHICVTQPQWVKASEHWCALPELNLDLQDNGKVTPKWTLFKFAHKILP